MLVGDYIKVQIKSAAANKNRDGYQANVSSRSKGNGLKRRKYTRSDVDYFFIVSPDGSFAWVMPVEVAERFNCGRVHLGERFNSFKEPIIPHPDYPTNLTATSPPLPADMFQGAPVASQHSDASPSGDNKRFLGSTEQSAGSLFLI